MKHQPPALQQLYMNRGVSAPLERLPIKFSSLRNKCGCLIKQWSSSQMLQQLISCQQKMAWTFKYTVKIKIQNKTWDTETRQRITAILQHLSIEQQTYELSLNELFPLTNRFFSPAPFRGCRRFPNISNAQYITPPLSGLRRRISIVASLIIVVTKTINFTTKTLEPTRTYWHCCEVCLLCINHFRRIKS